MKRKRMSMVMDFSNLKVKGGFYLTEMYKDELKCNNPEACFKSDVKETYSK